MPTGNRGDFREYLGAEATFSLVGLRYVPLRLHLDDVVPRDPVLLLGDSYAQGLGEKTDHNRNGPFHSAHVINMLSGRDVVTLGVAGAGSAEGMAA